MKTPPSPCWELGNIDKSISNIALVGTENVPRFLAAHAPIQNIIDESTNQNLTDEDLFTQLIETPKKEMLVVLYGMPGSGKSHLINWLKIKYDNEIENNDLKNVLPVLIKRRNGSLKDALDQLINQLPSSYQNYVQKISDAVNAISHSEAKVKLLAELNYELDIRWKEREEEYPDGLENISNIFLSTGFRDWFLREDTVIDKNIKLLQSDSEIEERENFPLFQASDFDLETKYLSRQLHNPNVHELLDYYEDNFQNIRDKSADMCNKVLRNAIKSFAGLNNRELSSVLDDIRRDLKKENKKLIFLIEDVSTLSVLDNEIVQSVFPKNDDNLCEITSVIGMTQPGFERLAENEYQRLDKILTFSNSSSGVDWYQDPNYLNKFAARYLNSIRLNEEKVSDISQNRKFGKDISFSKCKTCQYKEKCFDIFGFEEFENDIKVGLFPFNKVSFSKMISSLNEQGSVRKSQRGFLVNIISPLMEYFYNELNQSNHNVPRHGFNTRITQDSENFTIKYLGQWTDNQKNLGKFYFDFYSDTTDPSKSAVQLQKIFEILKLPKFSEQITSSQPDDRPEPKPLKPDQPKKNKKYEEMINYLSDWFNNKVNLVKSREFQSYIQNFLKESLRFSDDQLHVNSYLREYLDKNIDVIDIEAMDKTARSSFQITFSRNKENFEFISTLTRFVLVGDQTWNYENGEKDARVISTWINNQKDNLLKKFSPNFETDLTSIESCVEIAVHYMMIIYVMLSEKKLDQDEMTIYSNLMKFKPEFNTSPRYHSEHLSKIRDDNFERFNDLKSFVLKNVSIKQGSGGDNFFDPRSILSSIKKNKDKLSFEKVNEKNFASKWGVEFSCLQTVQKNWTNFQDLVDDESKILNEKLNKIKAILINLGYKGNFEQNTLNIFLKDLKDLIKTSKENNLYHSETEIDNHTNMFETQLNQFLKNINELESGINDNNRLNILIYNSFNPFGLENSLKLFLDIENFAKEIESVTNINVEQTDPADDTLKEIKDKLIEVIKEND